MEKILLYIKRIIPKKLFKKAQPAYHFLLNWLAALVYRYPSNKLVVIGVTGTTGKTTTAYLILKVLENAGFKVGLTSTAIFNNGKKEWLNDKKMTMVGRFFTQKIMKQMVDNGCQYAIIETTSEGVVQYRHLFINYDILVFTGLYPEHIESHGSFEKYKMAKGKLFEHLSKCGSKFINESGIVVNTEKGIKKLDLNRVKKTIIVNGDDEYADFFLSFKAEKKFVYSEDKNKLEKYKSDIMFLHYSDVKSNEKGLSFKACEMEFQTNLLGRFNIYNAMNAFCVASVLGIGTDRIRNGLESITGVVGRLEKIDEGQDFVVIVDYAFEPNAVKKLYETIETIPGEQTRKILHVLGATGGGRDIARRPILGKIAGENADYVIVTNEDPYDDDPEIIIDQVALGAEQSGKRKNENLFMILDRREAIAKALSLAKKGDVVLITGKGSEQAICVANGEKIPWDDRRITRELLKK